MKKFKLIIIFLLLSIAGYSQCKIDVVVVADYSGSMEGNERYMHEALKAFANRFYAENDGVRIGIVMFNTNETVQMEVTDNTENIMNYLASMYKRAKGTTNMTFALMVAESMLITSTKGEDINKMIVLITDGRPDDDNTTRDIANKIKDQEINICAIKAGDVEDEYIEEISSDCFYGSTYEDLVQTIEELSLRCL